MTCPETYLPVTFDMFPAITSGDMYPTGLELREDGEDQTLASVSLVFKRDPSQTTPDLTLSSSNGGITIDSSVANNWIYTIPAFVVSLSAADYFFQLRTTDGMGAIRTAIIGTLTVNPAL
jgi:hypothetical protein